MLIDFNMELADAFYFLKKDFLSAIKFSEVDCLLYAPI